MRAVRDADERRGDIARRWSAGNKLGRVCGGGAARTQQIIHPARSCMMSMLLQ